MIHVARQEAVGLCMQRINLQGKLPRDWFTARHTHKYNDKTDIDRPNFVCSFNVLNMFVGLDT